MAVIPTRPIVLTQVDGFHLRVYTPEEVRSLSVKHITVPSCFTKDGDVVIGGPYDPCMGPIGRDDSCATCGLDEQGCQGHYGHIELPVPCYNSLLFGFLSKKISCGVMKLRLMFKILKSTCLHCFHLKMPKDLVEQYASKLVLIKTGHDVEALDITLRSTEPRIKSSVSAHSRGPSLLYPDFRISKCSAMMEAKKMLEQMSSLEIKNRTMTEPLMELYTATHKELMAAVDKRKKCANCGCISPKLKKEGSSKIFLRPLSPKDIASNANQKTVPCSPTSGAPVGQRPLDQFITQIEIMEIFRRLWSHQHASMDMIIGGVDSGVQGYRSYFYEVLPVIPNKFRPVNFRDGKREMHGQTSMLCKVIALSLDIRSIHEEQPSVDAQHQISNGAVVEKWLELQSTIHAMIEGDKGYTKSSIKDDSVRQILEKKEGLFRQHLMGKRVNFAARSTISPDISLGVGEVHLTHLDAFSFLL